VLVAGAQLVEREALVLDVAASRPVSDFSVFRLRRSL
jgi:hypothetical protein